MTRTSVPRAAPRRARGTEILCARDRHCEPLAAAFRALGGSEPRAGSDFSSVLLSLAKVRSLRWTRRTSLLFLLLWRGEGGGSYSRAVTQPVRMV